jgi:hypothetical protein
MALTAHDLFFWHFWLFFFGTTADGVGDWLRVVRELDVGPGGERESL